MHKDKLFFFFFFFFFFHFYGSASVLAPLTLGHGSTLAEGHRASI
jgi:hypothetical protein